RVVLVARFAQPGPTVEFPVVPRTDDVLTVDPAFAERAASVVADAGDGAERAVDAAHRNCCAATGDLLQRLAAQLRRISDIEPILGHVRLRCGDGIRPRPRRIGD